MNGQDERGARGHFRGRFAIILITVVIALLSLDMWLTRGESLSAEEAGLAGLRLEYRFESGRRYRAIYDTESVFFELLEPLLEEPPKQTLPYRSIRLRPGLFLVSWEGTDYAPVFVVDLERNEIHTRASLGDSKTFFATARIVSIEREDMAEAQPAP